MKKMNWKTRLVPVWLVLFLLLAAGTAAASETGHDHIDPGLLPKQTDTSAASSSVESASSSQAESASSSQVETASSSSGETAASSSDDAGTAGTEAKEVSGRTDRRLIIAEAAAALFAVIAIVLAIRLRKNGRAGSAPSSGSGSPSGTAAAGKAGAGKTGAADPEDYGETEMTRQRIDSYGETELVRERIDSYGETEFVSYGPETADGEKTGAKPEKPGQPDRYAEYDEIPDFDRNDS